MVQPADRHPLYGGQRLSSLPHPRSVLRERQDRAGFGDNALRRGTGVHICRGRDCPAPENREQAGRAVQATVYQAMQRSERDPASPV